MGYKKLLSDTDNSDLSSFPSVQRYNAGMKQITEHIYCMDSNPETDQPFVYYIRGTRYSLQIDAGNSKENYERFLTELNKESLPLPALMILTHWHWDHSFGVHASRCPVVSSVETDQILERISGWEWSEEAMKRRLETGEDILFTYECMKKQYPDLGNICVKRADITFTGKMIFNLGDITCIAEHRDSPHTRDAVFIYLPEEKILIGGDAHYEDYYDNNSQYDREKLSAFIDYLDAMDFKTYLKGHDEPEISKKELLVLLNGKLAELP